MLRILLIDDNQADRVLAIRHLKQAFADLEFQEVSNLQELTQALEGGKFDLVITDYQLRWSDGLQVLDSIKAGYPSCPVIMFTSSGSEEIAVQGMKLGLSDYVLKGRRLDRLAIAVQESLDKAQLRQQYREATQQLKLSEARYRTVSELTSDFAYAYRITPDQKWVRDWSTDAFSRMTGYTIAEIDAQGGYIGLVHPDDQAAVCQHRARLLAGHADMSAFRIKTKAGAIRWLQNFGQPEWDEAQQRVTVVYGAAQDITERKQAEVALQQQAHELAEANRLKDEFLTTLSHELRTPLSAILGWTKLLQSRLGQDETVMHALQTIERNARAQAQLIEDILDVSRIIQGKLQLNCIPSTLESIIQAAIESIYPAAEAKAIQIETALEPSMQRLLVDPNRLQQVIWNLLSNAIKFTPEGGKVEVRMALVPSSLPSDGQGKSHQPGKPDRPDQHAPYQTPSYAQITIRDTGIGIAPDFLPYVFDRFRQADSSVTRVHQGMGLGLAIVRHLVEMHGGTVQVESAGPGQGATFTIRLPSVTASTLTPDPISEPPSEPQPLQSQCQFSVEEPFAQTQPLNNLLILVVDDDPDTCEIVSIILEQQGASVIAATSVPEALSVMQQITTLDLLISDIAMPHEDGYSLIRKVRQLAARSGKLPAIALTAYARTEDRIRALSAGYQLHIPKPVEPNELTAAVVNLTGRNPD